jgi:hypothetical protein
VRWSAHALMVLLAFFAQRPSAQATDRSDLYRPYLLATRGPLFSPFDAAASMPLCPGCSGPWRVAMRLVMQQDEPLVALRMSRPLHLDGAMWGGLRHGAGWQLGIAAHALKQPGERQVMAGIQKRHHRTFFALGLEALEVDLPPVFGDSGNRRGKIRRTGAVVQFELGSGSSRLLARRRRAGFALGGTLRAWQPMGHPTMLDSHLALTAHMAPRGPRGAKLWGQGLWRGLIGSDDAVIAAGGWHLPSPMGETRHVMRQSMPGYEDTVRHTARLMQGQAGVTAPLGRAARLDLFAAASHVDTLSAQPGRWLRSLGARFDYRARSRRGLTPMVSYQVAHRFDGARGPWLHTLTASL